METAMTDITSTVYRITNTTSGTDLGVFVAKDQAAALDTMARDAGYRDHAHACEVTGTDGADLLVEAMTVKRAGNITSDTRGPNLLASEKRQLAEALGAALLEDSSPSWAPRMIRACAALLAGDYQVALGAVGVRSDASGPAGAACFDLVVAWAERREDAIDPA